MTKLTRFFAVKGQGQAHRAKRKTRVFPPGWKPWLDGRPEARRYLAARTTNGGHGFSNAGCDPWGEGGEMAVEAVRVQLGHGVNRPAA